MPTARELLEQADALMRRNRRRGSAKHGPPTLTDALGVDRDAPLAPTIILPESVVAEADPIALDTLSDLPVLTDVVDVWPSAASEVSSPSAEDELSPATLDDALEADALAAPSMRRTSARKAKQHRAYPSSLLTKHRRRGNAERARRFCLRSTGDGGNVERARRFSLRSAGNGSAACGTFNCNGR